jgi:hypothetical protein
MATPAVDRQLNSFGIRNPNPTAHLCDHASALIQIYMDQGL